MKRKLFRFTPLHRKQPASGKKAQGIIRGAGFTLVELLISCAILLLMITSATYLFAMGWRCFRNVSPEVDQLRIARKLIRQISENIMITDKIYASNTDFIALVKTSYSGNTAVVEVIGYRAVRTAGDLYDIYQVIYPLNYNPANLPVQPDSTLLLAKKIKDYNLTFSENLYNINFVIASENPQNPDVSFSTKVMRKKW